MIIRLLSSMFLSTLFVGCKTYYSTDYEMYRPNNPRFTIRSDANDLRVFDSVLFEIETVFYSKIELHNSDDFDMRLILSKDGRACVFIDSMRTDNNIPIIEKDIWLKSDGVGFYDRVNDKLIIEYFLPNNLGMYVTFSGVINSKGDFELNEVRKGGGRNRSSWRDNNAGADYFVKTEWIEL